MTLSSIVVGTTLASLKSDASSSPLNSVSVRSRPPIKAIIVMSPRVPWETSPAYASTLSISKSRPSSAIASRQIFKMAMACASSQSWMIHLST